MSSDTWWRENRYWRSGQPTPTSLGELITEATSSDSDRINVSLYEARRRNLLPLLFKALAQHQGSQPANRSAFHAAWTAQGLWIRDAFHVDDILLDVLRNHLPGYSGPSLRLFRGERRSNHENKTYGPSWTTSVDTAQTFARGLNCVAPEGGVVIATTAPASAILAAPNEQSNYLGEDEYILDRRALVAVEAVERFRY